MKNASAAARMWRLVSRSAAAGGVSATNLRLSGPIGAFAVPCVCLSAYLTISKLMQSIPRREQSVKALLPGGGLPPLAPEVLVAKRDVMLGELHWRRGEWAPPKPWLD